MVYKKRKVPEVLVLTMAATCSLECTSRDCTLGDNGGRWKTPELESGLAMQMLVMHREDNHQQPLDSVLLFDQMVFV